MRNMPCGSLWSMRRLARAVGSEAGDILTAGRGATVSNTFKVRNRVTNEVRMARYTTDHAVSRYGIPALVLDDGQVAAELFWGLELEDPVEQAQGGVTRAGAQSVPAKRRSAVLGENRGGAG